MLGKLSIVQHATEVLPIPYNGITSQIAEERPGLFLGNPSSPCRSVGSVKLGLRHFQSSISCLRIVQSRERNDTELIASADVDNKTLLSADHDTKHKQWA